MKIAKTSNEILDFINKEISFNEGIITTDVIGNIEDDEVVIGVSYEDDDNGEDVYIYNIFVGNEYINIGNTGNKENKTPISVIDEIKDTLLEI